MGVAIGRSADRAGGGKLTSRLGFFAASLTQALTLVLALAACRPAALEPQLSYEGGRVRAAGWTGARPSGGWESVLEVRAGDDPTVPALLGEYQQSGGVITFTPRFPPSPGVGLRVVFRTNDSGELSGIFGEPAQALAATTRVAQIYPTVEEWPANTLKMYIEFSAPMAKGEAYSHVRVLDEKGNVIEGPFVEIGEELWDQSLVRVTLLFDPGRIKRGLVDNEASGPPLMPGATITIEIDPSWRDARGGPLAQKTSRRVRVTEALRKPVDEKLWRVEPPRLPAGPLVIAFDRPLDHAIAPRAIRITRNGSPVAGAMMLERSQTQLRFTPDAPWSPGAYAIEVDGVIEDLAGNRLGKAFDVETSDASHATAAKPSAQIAFAISGR